MMKNKNKALAPDEGFQFQFPIGVSNGFSKGLTSVFQSKLEWEAV
jgi:hypothetical protein